MRCIVENDKRIFKYLKSFFDAILKREEMIKCLKFIIT